jgi:hypothetical protein
MSAPRTTREALIAQMLGELDGLLTRAERLPEAITEAESRLAATSRVLSDAGDRYRIAVTVFTEEAKSVLTGYLEQKMSEVAALTAEERRMIIQEAVRHAYQLWVSEGIGRDQQDTDRSKRVNRHPSLGRLLEHGVTAALASVLTAALVFLVVTFS